MRIGITCYPTYGGSGAAAMELARHLATKGHEVHVISSDRPFRFGPAGYQENLFLHEIASVQYPVLKSELYTLSCAVKMAQLIREQELDILHSHYAVPHAVSAMMARDLCPDHPVRLVTTLHGTDITLTGSNPAFAPVVRLGIARSDAVISVSDWLREETHRRFGVCKGQCHVIHNFVDSDVFRREESPCCARAFAREVGQKTVLHISNFRPVKRVRDVIDTFARIVKEVPAILLMIGDGPDHDLAVERANELGIAGQVRFLGLQNDITTLLSIGDLLLFPSEYESFGLAALEAMACEVPVVASNGGGLPEVIEDGVTGFLCDVGDVESMARRGIELLQDETKARAMGKAARQSACEKFSPEVAIRAHEELYERLIQANSGAKGD